MIERIILNIEPRDPYLEYLFQTASLTSRRVVPMLRPSPDDLAKAKGDNDMVLRCCDRAYRRKTGRDMVIFHYQSIIVYRGFYLTPQGTVHTTRTLIAKQQIERILSDILEDPANLREAYRKNFGLLWGRRDRIYADPRLFFARSGLSTSRGEPVPLGAMLRAMEEYPEDFSVPASEWHPCGVPQLIIDFQYDLPDKDGGWDWNFHRFCPVCGEVTFELRKGALRGDRNRLSRLVRRTMTRYSDGMGMSGLTVLDVIDRLEEEQAADD